MTKNKPEKRYVPPMAAKAARVDINTLGGPYTLKDHSTWGFRKPRS